MRKLFIQMLFLVLVPALVFNGCKKDEEDPKGNFDALKTYMVANNLDLPALLTTPTSWVVDPKLIADGGIIDPADYSIPGYYVFDIRSAADFALGHIKGAVNVTLAGIITAAAGKTDKPILVVCATGQTAGQGCMALRLSGFSNAQVLKWGMSGWNADFSAGWDAAVGNTAVGNANWVTTPTAASTYGYPEWTSTATDGAALLAERVQAVLTAGFSPQVPADVLANPANYSIVNYWVDADYTGIGHFAGAVRINPISLVGNEITGIDPNDPTLLYCYTGMTSSIVTAWLNVLGYNTKSIKWGVNALSWDALNAAGKTVWKGPKTYTYVTGA
jgi:rhodanese-related sulfurtransferase